MNERQKVEVRQIEVRARIRELAGLDELTEEHRSELDALKGEARDLDTKLAALIAAGDDREGDRVTGDDGEAAELAELRSRASVADVLGAVVRQAVPTGAIAELQQHHGLGSHSVPLELIAEHRAASVALPAAVSDNPVQANQQPTVQPVFPTPAAAAMGIERVMVPPGQALFPVISAPEDGAAETARGGTTADTTVTIAASPLAPARVQMNAVYAVEDAGQFANIEDDVRATLRAAVESGLDRQAVSKLVALAATAADGTTETFASYQAVPLGLIDGRYAAGPGAVAALIGSETLAAMAAVYRGDQQVQSAYEWAVDQLREVAVSAYIPAAASGVQSALFFRGGMPATKQPIWGMDLIIDRVTGLQEGEVRVAAVTLANAAIVRDGQYHREIYDIS